MAPDNGNGPSATELLTKLNSTRDNFEQHAILGQMLALHLESYSRFKVRISMFCTGFVGVLVGLGGAILTHIMG